MHKQKYPIKLLKTKLDLTFAKKLVAEGKFDIPLVKTKNDMQRLGITRGCFQEIFKSLSRVHFKESMPRYNEHTKWLDVYIFCHPKYGALYIKFGFDDDGQLILLFSCKEDIKENLSL